MKRTPIRRVSKKRMRDMREYSKLRKEFLEKHVNCQAWPVIRCHLKMHGLPPPPSTEVHHKAKRGKNYLNTDTWLAVCRASHEWIENHKNVARQLGLLENI